MDDAPHVIDAATIRRLAGHRGEPVVTSLYLDVDGARRPVAADYERAFEQLADELRREARASHDPDVPPAVEADVATMRARLARGVDRSTTRGLALFACHRQDWHEAIDLPVPVRDQVAIGRTPHLRQLVEAYDEYEPVLVALADRDELRLVRVLGRDAEHVDRLVTPLERAVDTSTEIGSFERRHEEAALRHLRRAAAAVDDAVRAGTAPHLVLGGPDEAVAELERQLHPTTRERVIGRIGVRVAAPIGEIGDRAREVATRAERDREAALVEDARQRAAGNHGAVIGLGATLSVLAEQRGRVLLIADGYSMPGARCPACGHVDADARRCPTCGTPTVELDDVVAAAIELALAQGADIEFCHATELGQLGGIAVIERY